MAKFKNRVGDKHGRLTVVSHAGKDFRNKHLWLCLCDCGNEKVVVSDNLSRGKSNSCGCILAEFLSSKVHKYVLFTDREKVLLTVQYSGLKKRNKKLGFNNIMSFDSFCLKVKSACEYCGMEYSKEIEDRLSESKKQKRLSGYILKCNGIDRVDSSLSYSESNTVPCCKICNFAKYTMTKEEFFMWIKRVYNHNFK